MRGALILGGFAVAGAALFAAGPAGATVNGPCSGSAELSGDDGSVVVVDAAETGRVTIPRAADVAYQGAIAISPQPDMPYSGSITLEVAPGLDLIPGLDDPTLASWSWAGETDEVETAGDTDYDLDLPADLGGGIKATVSGSHTQAGTTCTGSVDLRVGGSTVNLASIGSAVLAGAGAAGLAVAARGKP